MKPTNEEIAAAAFSQFGIVADDTELVAFAEWVLAQRAPAYDHLVAALKLGRAEIDAVQMSESYVYGPEPDVLDKIDAVLTAAGAV